MKSLRQFIVDMAVTFTVLAADLAHTIRNRTK